MSDRPTGPELLKKMRASKGWTQAEMAEHLGLSTITVGQYERGTRGFKYDLLQRWAEICGWRIEAFQPGATEGETVAASLRQLPPGEEALARRIIELLPGQDLDVLAVVLGMLRLKTNNSDTKTIHKE